MIGHLLLKREHFICDLLYVFNCFSSKLFKFTWNILTHLFSKLLHRGREERNVVLTQQLYLEPVATKQHLRYTPLLAHESAVVQHERLQVLHDFTTHISWFRDCQHFIKHLDSFRNAIS